VFTLAAHDLGCGAVGGVLRDWTMIGHILATETLALLGDLERAPSVTTVPLARFTRLEFDARQLARWSIPESRLPAGSMVSFRPHTLWTDYPKQVASAIVVAAILTVLVAGLVLERAQRRRAEHEAQQHLVVAAHLDRRVALGDLAGALAHELNQPLNAILQNAGVAQMLLISGSTPAVAREMADILEDIRKDNLRASEVIKRMRSLLQRHELETTVLDPNELARETAALVRSSAIAHGIRLEMDLAEPVPSIGGDRVHLQQVLLNLLLNAVDAVHAMPPDRRTIVVSTRSSRGCVQIAVRDRGVGIRADREVQIFEPFYTTKGEGMGMGLAIAHSIIEAHAGRMDASNNRDGGATISFTVPTVGSAA
jgi:C4-dicarboxylate-specific signal transduction histidine kinase